MRLPPLSVDTPSALTTTTQHTSPYTTTNVCKFHYTSIIYNICTQLPIKLSLPIMLLASNYAPSYQLCSWLSIMLLASNYAPGYQLCSWLSIMPWLSIVLLAINYAQNYASIIGKGLLRDPLGKAYSCVKAAET